MKAAVINLNALVNLKNALSQMVTLDLKPLLEKGEEILREGNREGLIAGTDHSGTRLKTTWRETHPENHWMRASGVAKASRKGQYFLAKGYHEAGKGRPLVPNEEMSRAITHVRTDHGQPSEHTYSVILWWDGAGFTTEQGDHILDLHASPRAGARYPRRDIQGVRPETVKKFEEAAKAYITAAIKRQTKTG
jgi:hypothetical protein